MTKNKKCPQCPKTFSSRSGLRYHLKTHGEGRTKLKCKYPQCLKEYGVIRNLKLHTQKAHLGTFKKLQCHMCSSTFMSNFSRNQHILGAHVGVKKFECEKCPKKFATQRKLYQHGLDHTVKKPHKCLLCRKQFKRPYYLKRHTENAHSTVSVECRQCGKGYPSLSALESHLKIHIKDRPTFSCSYCSKEFKGAQGLNLHLKKIHLNTFKKLECNFCDSKFMSKPNRDDHIVAVHTLEKAFQCEQCPSRFSSRQVLWQHQFTHRDEKPYKCLTCFKQFKRIADLKKHTEIVHSTNKSRDFQCPICYRAFFTKPNLRSHEQTHIQSARKYSCYFCKSSFIKRPQLEDHTRTHTQEKPFVCPVKSCHYSSCNPGNLIRHTKIQHIPAKSRPPSKIWACYFCYGTMTRFDSLTNHLRTHTREVPFTCGLCRKHFKTQYNLKYHISILHTREKPYKCGDCSQCFFSNGNLQAHLRTIHGKYLFL